jgi:probable phosphoglycerate mutase
LRILIVRHGATLWSVSGQYTGRTDLPLTESGEAEARALAPLLREFRPLLVLSSPLSRARKTAELAGFGPVLETCADLMEWNYGLYEGLRASDIRQQAPDWDLWRDGAPGGENAFEVARRALRVLARARKVSGDTLLFSHAHFLRVLIAICLTLPPESGRHFVLPTGRLSILGTDHDCPALLALNLSPYPENVHPPRQKESHP